MKTNTTEVDRKTHFRSLAEPWADMSTWRLVGGKMTPKTLPSRAQRVYLREASTLHPLFFTGEVDC
jgi:hypothetical protein